MLVTKSVFMLTIILSILNSVQCLQWIIRSNTNLFWLFSVILVNVIAKSNRTQNRYVCIQVINNLICPSITNKKHNWALLCLSYWQTMCVVYTMWLQRCVIQLYSRNSSSFVSLFFLLFCVWEKYTSQRNFLKTRGHGYFEDISPNEPPFI